MSYKCNIIRYQKMDKRKNSDFRGKTLRNVWDYLQSVPSAPLSTITKETRGGFYAIRNVLEMLRKFELIERIEGTGVTLYRISEKGKEINERNNKSVKKNADLKHTSMSGRQITT